MSFRRIYTLIFGLQLCLLSYGQSYQKEIYKAYVDYDVNRWLKAAKYVENSNQGQTEKMLNLIHCYYGYTSSLMSLKQNDEAEKTIGKAEILIDKILKTDPDNALALNYKGVFLGYEIGLSKMKALKYGTKSTSYIDNALKLAPNNVQILFDKGNALYYPPKVFGGNKNEALKYFQKAIGIIEKQKKTNENWVYLQLLALEGRCYELNGNYTKAEHSYQKALKVEPEFKFVKNTLYPRLRKTLSDASTNQKQDDSPENEIYR